MTNNIKWLTDFCESKQIVVSIIMIQIVVLIYALSFLAFNSEFLRKLSMLTLLCQFTGLNIIITLCKLNKYFNSFSVSVGVILLIIYLIILTSLLSQIIGYYDFILGFNILSNQIAINYLNIKLSLSSVMICLALIRYFYIQDQWNQQILKHSEARLNALQARIKPHFLFNSLNSIASLITIDPDKAEVAIADFSNLMRRTFTHKNKNITINEELNWVNQYLSIEKLRLDKRLQYQIKCDESLLPKNIPVLCLQPLVENAILHGIQPLENGGTIAISISKVQKTCVIQVSNPYIIYENKHSNGMAIANIRERLQLQYGNKANLRIKDTGKKYQASLRIPL